MKRTDHKKHDDEVVIDLDSDDAIATHDEEITEAVLRDKLTSVRAELTSVRKERDEYLTGWQRAKAELVNYRRMVTDDKERDTLRAKGAILRAVIPVLDSFENASAVPSWNTAPPEWREGVERIRTQLMKALTAEGLESFGTVGEAFDPVRHECMRVVATDNPADDHTVSDVLQRGYMLGSEMIRPAKVTVAEASTT